MAHSIQIEFGSEPSISVSGELTFCGTSPCVTLESVDKMTLKQYKKVQNLLEVLSNFNQECGEIQSIEINKES